MSAKELFPWSTRWAFNFKNWQPTKEEWCQAIVQVQEEERDRINKFRYCDDAKASLVGRLMMRRWAEQFLSAIGSCKIQPEFERTEKGRPKLILSDVDENLANYIYFDFNVAHAGELTVLAAEVSTCPTAIGVDVMPLNDKRALKLEDFFYLMKRQFTNDEWTQIRRTPEERNQRDNESLKNFLRFWCLKESFVKAEGSGLAWNLQRLSFNCPSNNASSGAVLTDTELKIDELSVQGWQFQEYLLQPNHCVAVAVKDTAPADKHNQKVELFNHLTLTELLETNISQKIDTSAKAVEAQKKEWEKFKEKELVKPF